MKIWQGRVGHCRRVIVLLALVASLVPAGLYAHGGGTPVLTRVEAGPFWLYVFTEPATPQAGAEYHVSVAVTEPQEDGSELPVQDAVVTVQFVPASGSPLNERAEASIAGPGYYEADVVLPSDGAWRIVVEAQSPLGIGSAEYQVEALAASGVNWGWIGAGVAMVLAGAGIFAFAFTRRGRPDGSVEEESEDAQNGEIQDVSEALS